MGPFLEIGAATGACLVLLADVFTPEGRKARVGLLSVAVAAALCAGAWLLLEPSEGPDPVFGGSLVHDALSVFLKRVFATAGLLAVLLAVRYEERLPRGRGEFHFLLLAALSGMFLVSGVGDFMSLFVCLELVTLSFFVLAAFKREEAASVEAGLKLLVLGSLAAAFILFGIALIYGAVGDLSFEALRRFLAARSSDLLGATDPSVRHPELVLGILLVFLGLGFKIGMVPLQVWVPDVYQGAPTPVTAFLSVGSKAAGFALLLRLNASIAGPGTERSLQLLFTALAFATLFYGNLAAIPQTNVKRLMGYSSIGHCGYMLLGFAVLRVGGDSLVGGEGGRFDPATAAEGTGAVLFYLLAYAFTNMAAFVAIVVFSGATGSHELDDYAGLSRRSPLLAGSLTVALLSLAGVPPLAGFFGKFLLLRSVALTGPEGLLLLAAAGVNIVIGLYYYLCVIKRMYIHPPKDPSPIAVPAGTKALLYALIGAIVLLGVFPGEAVAAATRAARQAFGLQ